MADLAAAAARRLGLPDAEAMTIRRAGLVHDLGRLGVSNAIWDKRGPLTRAELERVRLHPYLTERMLAFSAALAPLGAIAVQHHERLDGSGYPRGLSGPALTPGGAAPRRGRRLPRHDRAAAAPAGALARRGGGARCAPRSTAGRLDGDAVDAVLARGRPPGQAAGATGPPGLTAREVEVLRLVARGLSNKEIAAQLVITRKTAGNHVEHVYAKIGVSNRARASLFAMQHGLMTPTRTPNDTVAGVTTVAERRTRFGELHADGLFLLPNPSDVGRRGCSRRAGSRRSRRRAPASRGRSADSTGASRARSSSRTWPR